MVQQLETVVVAQEQAVQAFMAEVQEEYKVLSALETAFSNMVLEAVGNLTLDASSSATPLAHFYLGKPVPKLPIKPSRFMSKLFHSFYTRILRFNSQNSL